MKNSWIFENVRVLKEDFTFAYASVTVQNGIVIAIGQPEEKGLQRIDGTGLTLIPGLIDTHFHGAQGKHFGHIGPEEICEVAAFEAKQGVTSIVPSVSTTTDKNVFDTLQSVQAVMASGSGGARVEGVHLEGPFLSMEYRGAQCPTYIQSPTVEKLHAFWEASGGCIRILTLAPECGEAKAVICAAKALGIAVAIGHTGADYETAKAAIDCGATIATHTFNGMVGLHHRAPGVLGAVLTDDRVSCEIIADFVHLHPATVDLICRAKGMERIHLISDSISFAGLPDGDYLEDGRVCHVQNGACLLDDGRNNGSTYPISYGMKNLLKLGVPLETAVMAASANPAKAAGIFDHTGSIAPGKRADIVLLDAKLDVVATFVDGICVYSKEEGFLCG